MLTSLCSLPSNGSYTKLKPYAHIPMFTPKQWELRKVKALCSHPNVHSQAMGATHYAHIPVFTPKQWELRIMHTSQCSLPSNGSYAKLKHTSQDAKSLDAIVKTNTHILWMQGVRRGRTALIVYFHPCMAEVTHKHMLCECKVSSGCVHSHIPAGVQKLQQIRTI